MAVTLNASTSSGFIQTADTSGELNLQSNGSTKLSVLSTGVSGTIVQGTAVASTSGTSINFSSIPSWVKKITVMFSGVSTSGTSPLQIQIGTGGAPTTSGYQNAYGNTSATGTTATTAGFAMQIVSASAATGGIATLTNLTGNTWSSMSILSESATPRVALQAGSVAIAGVLDYVRITTVNGTDTFDAGSINILYEG